MAKKNKSDLFIYIIGIAIIVFILFKIIGYILPDQESEYTGTTLLQAVMEKNGGEDAWNTIEKIAYKKSFQLYKEDGSIEIDRVENHLYDFIDGVNREVTWNQKDTLFEIHRSDSAVYQIKNGVLDTLVTSKLLQTKLNASTFVVGLPFTLNNQNATLIYKGIVDFQKTSCHYLKVNFKNSKDVWSLYYEEKSLDWKGYWVQTNDHYSLVINEEMVNVNGISFSRKRKSYRTDKNQKPTYKRASYIYDNYVIK